MKNTKKENYKLMQDAYEGAGGFADGTYLEQHTRESAEKYAKRKKLAYYLNYLKPCVDAHVDPIFKREAVRDYEGSGAKVWEEFLKDVDFANTGIKQFMKRAALLSKLQGVCFIVMDRERDAQGNNVLELEVNRSKIPYVFCVSPRRVNEIKVDKFGRIIYFEYEEPSDDETKANARRILTPQGWMRVDDGKTESGTWDFGGAVPIVPLYSVEHDPFNPLPTSDFLSIAKTNCNIFNECSWLNDILLNQTFSILVYPSTQEDDLTIGTSNALGFPADASHFPQFIAPSADPATILRDNIKTLQEECYRMAGVVNVTGVRVASSGTAKAWDFEQTNQILASFADQVEQAEKRIADLFARFCGIELEYSVAYPSDFSIADIATELANAEIAKGLGFGDDFNIEVYKRVLSSYLPEISDEVFDDLVENYKLKLKNETSDQNIELSNE